MGFVANCVFNLNAGIPARIQSSPQDQILSPELLLAACGDVKPSILNTVPWIMEGIAEMLASGDREPKKLSNILK